MDKLTRLEEARKRQETKNEITKDTTKDTTSSKALTRLEEARKRQETAKLEIPKTEKPKVEYTDEDLLARAKQGSIGLVGLPEEDIIRASRLYVKSALNDKPTTPIEKAKDIQNNINNTISSKIGIDPNKIDTSYNVAVDKEKYKLGTNDNKFSANYKFGKLQVEHNKAMYNYITTNDKTYLSEANNLKDTMQWYVENNPNVNKGWLISKDLMSYLPQLFGQEAYGFKEGLAGGLMGGAGAAGTALVAGQLGPQVALPEEIATVPGAFAIGFPSGYTGGRAVGVAKFSYEQMLGAAFSDLIELGVPEYIALNIARDTAFWQAIVEGGDALFDVWNFGKNIFTGGAKETAAKTFRNKVFDIAKSYGWNLVQETAEETIQEKIGIEGEKKATKQAGIERTATKEEDLKRIAEAGFGGFKIALVTGVFGAGVQTIPLAKYKQETNNINKQYDNFVKEVNNSNLTDEQKSIAIQEATKTRDEVVNKVNVEYEVRGKEKLSQNNTTKKETQEVSTEEPLKNTGAYSNDNEKFSKSLYVINKEAKKIRDLRDVLKLNLFDGREIVDENLDNYIKSKFGKTYTELFTKHDEYDREITPHNIDDIIEETTKEYFRMGYMVSELRRKCSR